MILHNHSDDLEFDLGLDPYYNSIPSLDSHISSAWNESSDIIVTRRLGESDRVTDNPPLTDVTTSDDLALSEKLFDPYISSVHPDVAFIGVSPVSPSSCTNKSISSSAPQARSSHGPDIEKSFDISDYITYYDPNPEQMAFWYGTKGELDALQCSDSHDVDIQNRKCGHATPLVDAQPSTISDPVWELGQYTTFDQPVLNTNQSAKSSSLPFSYPPALIGIPEASSPLIIIPEASLPIPSPSPDISLRLSPGSSLPSRDSKKRKSTIEGERQEQAKKQRLADSSGDSLTSRLFSAKPRRAFDHSRSYRCRKYIEDKESRSCRFCNKIFNRRVDRTLDHFWAHVAPELREMEGNRRFPLNREFIRSEKEYEFLKEHVPRCADCHPRKTYQCFRSDVIGQHYDNHRISEGKAIDDYTESDKAKKQDFLESAVMRSGYYNVADYLICGVFRIREKEREV